MEERTGSRSDAQRFEEIQKEIRKDFESEDSQDRAEESDVADDSEISEVDVTPSPEEVLQSKLTETEARLTRLQADFENFRRRTAKEKSEVSAIVSQGILTDLLPLIDNFERAAAAEGEDLPSYRKGIEMILGQLREIAIKNGLEEIAAEGGVFDPNFHQAVLRSESAEHPEGTILQVLQKGYQAHGRVLRPSMVQVAGS